MVEWYLTLYFKEVFFYWDHGSLDIDLITWYQPDIIIELRIERFLENLQDPLWVKNRINLSF